MMMTTDNDDDDDNNLLLCSFSKGVARIFAMGCTLFLPQKLMTFFSHCPQYTG